MQHDVLYFERAATLERNQDWRGLLDHATGWSSAEPANRFAWQSMGHALRKLERPEEAVHAYQRGLSVAPSNAVAKQQGIVGAGPLWHGLGHAHHDLGQIEEAFSAFKKCVLADPNASEPWNDLGVLYSEVNDVSGAFQSFKRAVAADPSSLSSLKNLGIVYAICGQPEGVEYVRAAIQRIDPAEAGPFSAAAATAAASRGGI